MPTNYVRYARSQPVVLLYDESEPATDRVLIFDPVLEEFGSETAGNRFRKVDIAFRDADLIIFRGATSWTLGQPLSLKDVLAGDKIIRELTKDARVAVFHPKLKRPDPELRLDQLVADPWLGADRSKWMSIVKRVEIQALTKNAGAELRGHFALPSGIHTDTFLSIRRLLRDPITVARLADWFLPDLKGLEGILTDQVPMLPLVYALQAVSARLYGTFPLVKVLDEYPADHKTVADALQALGDEGGEQRQLLFLLSVTHTGRLLRNYRAAAIPASTVRVIFSTTPAGVEIPGVEPLLFVPSTEYSLSTDGQCELCHRGLPLERINPQTFEPESATQFRPLKASISYLARHAKFWGIVDEMDAVRLHYDDEHLRHHAVYLEIDRLLAHPGFRQESLKKLREMRVAHEKGLSPELVLIPHHSASEVVRDLVGEVFPSARIEILPRGSIRIPPEMGPRIAASKYVVIADDAVVTSKTFTDLKLQIYGICRKYGRSPEVDFFALVGRPQSSQGLKWLKNRLFDSIGSHLHCVYEINLPHPGRATCPLCDEQQILERYLAQLSAAAKEYARERLRALQSYVEEPLYTSKGTRVVNSFMVTDHEGRPQNARRRTVFAATQAAAMLLRDEVETGEHESKTWRIDVSDIISKYYDPEILGGFLRSIGRRFLSWPSNPEEIALQLSDFPDGEGSKEVLAEMGWAAVLGRLPAAGVLDHLRELEEEPLILTMRELIEMNILVSADGGTIVERGA